MVDSVSEKVSVWKETWMYQLIVIIGCIIIYEIIGKYLPIGSYSTFGSAIIVIVLIYLLGKLEGETFIERSFVNPDKWGREWVSALVKSCLILIASAYILFPFIDIILDNTPDYSAFKILEGNISLLIIQLIIVWTIVAFGEEIIFRGFLMGRIKKIVGNKRLGQFLNVIISSSIFGFLHSYQGLSGQIFTGLIGVFLAINFIYKEYNLWQNILIHGFIDTIAMILFFYGLYI